MSARSSAGSAGSGPSAGSAGSGWRARAGALKREVRTLVAVWRHPRVPWYSKALVLLVVAYAVSPIDLIPDFIPVLGLVDDLLLVPIGIWLVLKTLPEGVLEECRARGEETTPSRWQALGLALVLLSWAILVALVWRLLS